MTSWLSHGASSNSWGSSSPAPDPRNGNGGNGGNGGGRYLQYDDDDDDGPPVFNSIASAVPRDIARQNVVRDLLFPLRKLSPKISSVGI